MKVLVACEFSGIVRDAFTRAGHEATSCDVLPSESEGDHYQGDVLDILNQGWDLMVAHPPCTYLASAGNRWLYTTEPSKNGALTGFARWEALIEGATFFKQLLDASIPHIAVENPRMNRHATAIVGPPTQTVQPYQFGHLETKGVSLWLRGLPPLIASEDGLGAMLARPYVERAAVHSMGPSPTRARERSRFFTGIADAMATQWGTT